MPYDAVYACEERASHQCLGVMHSLKAHKPSFSFKLIGGLHLLQVMTCIRLHALLQQHLHTHQVPSPTSGMS